MPLDAGGAADLGFPAEPEPARAPAPDLDASPDLGQALKAVREHRGLSLEALAETTRVRASYLAALEAMQLEKLPSRPFTIGYVRAYAQALGLDAEAAVERFKAEEPVLDEPLRNPLGVHDDRDPRLTMIVAGICVIGAAILLWNLAQRGLTAAAPPPSKAADPVAERALEAVKAGPVSLGAPLPAPVESTTPPAYETPGLAEADANGVNHSPPAQLGVRREGEAAVDPATLAPVFTPKGRIYGASPGEPSAVTLQALKPASLVVRGADGAIYFARQLAEGEAYRAPQRGGLVADAEPDHFQVFVGGQSKGLLPAKLTEIARLAQ